MISTSHSYMITGLYRKVNVAMLVIVGSYILLAGQKDSRDSSEYLYDGLLLSFCLCKSYI